MKKDIKKLTFTEVRIMEMNKLFKDYKEIVEKINQYKPSENSERKLHPIVKRETDRITKKALKELAMLTSMTGHEKRWANFNPFKNLK